MDDEETTYGLLMPFLPVTSRGGPYEDVAYVAGYEMGLLDADLGYGVFRLIARPLRAENREQADLIAMRHGYRMEVSSEGEGWIMTNFTKEGV